MSRQGEITYSDLAQWSQRRAGGQLHARGHVPQLPCKRLCSLDELTQLEAVVDIVYNPARTGLMMQAEARDIPYVGGLLMLVAQAAQAVERYTGETVSRDRIMEVTKALSLTEQNIALIGMPGSGKTRVGENLAQITGREHSTWTTLLNRWSARPAQNLSFERGEDAFREQETKVRPMLPLAAGLSSLAKGGVVTREENDGLLHQNSRIVMLNRNIDELAHKGRPITARDGVDKLAQQRMPLDRAWADMVVDSLDCAEATAREVARRLGEPQAL